MPKGLPKPQLDFREHADETGLPTGFVAVTFVVDRDHGTTSKMRPPHDRGGHVGENAHAPQSAGRKSMFAAAAAQQKKPGGRNISGDRANRVSGYRLPFT